MVQAVNSHFVTSDNSKCWKMHMRFEFIFTEYIIISPATNILKTKCLLSTSVQLKAVFIDLFNFEVHYNKTYLYI